MIEQILAVEVCLRHASVQLLQKSEVAVNIDHRRHNGFAAQIDARRARRKLKFAFSTDAGEPVVSDDERGVFYRRLAVAREEPRTFKQDCRSCRLTLLHSSRRGRRYPKQSNTKTQRHKATKKGRINNS